MFGRAFIVLAIAIGVSGSAGAAQASGSGRRIPCLSEEVIKVASVPHDAGMALAAQWGVDPARIRSGYGVDLGYRFKPCSSDGRWVGYIGYSETDLDLDDQQLDQLAAAAGLAALPPKPSIWRNPDIEMLLAACALAALFGVIRLARNNGQS